MSSETSVQFKDDNFWTTDTGVLVRKDRLIEFVPTIDMTKDERLNAIARLAIYIGIVLMLYLGRGWPLYIPVVGLAFTAFLHKTQPQTIISPRYPSDETPKTGDPNPFIPSQQPECIPPTLNNPFMNVLMNEYVDNPTRPPACEYEDVHDELESNFHYNLYQDLGDNIWQKNNSQRQFFTMPSTTIPNEQGKFARWLYKVGGVCKQDQNACLRHEDLRSNRSVVGDSEYLV